MKKFYIPMGYRIVAEELKTKRVQLVMRPSLLNRAKAMAEAMDVSFNEFVHIAIEEFLENSK